MAAHLRVVLSRAMLGVLKYAEPPQGVRRGEFPGHRGSLLGRSPKLEQQGPVVGRALRDGVVDDVARPDPCRKRP